MILHHIMDMLRKASAGMDLLSRNMLNGVRRMRLLGDHKRNQRQPHADKDDFTVL